MISNLLRHLTCHCLHWCHESNLSCCSTTWNGFSLADNQVCMTEKVCSFIRNCCMNLRCEEQDWTHRISYVCCFPWCFCPTKAVAVWWFGLVMGRSWFEFKVLERSWSMQISQYRFDDIILIRSYAYIIEWCNTDAPSNYRVFRLRFRLQMNKLSQDDPEVKPELPDYLAALHACEVREVCGQFERRYTRPKRWILCIFFGVVILLLWFTQTIMTCFYLIVVRISGNTSTKTEWLNPHVFKMSRDLLFWIRVYWQILTYLQTYRIFPAIPGVGTMATPWHQRDL